MSKIKSAIKLFIPPIFLKVFSLKKKTPIQFQKTNLSWDDVLIQTKDGYSKENILIKCKESLLKVKNGEYPYERDSVLFTEKEIFFPLLSSLLYVSSKNNNTLNIIDFGGSLGSTYFQNKDILKQAGITINWNIIEQDNFVKCGNESFSNDELKFYNNIDEISNKNEISVCLFSSVLPYLKEPYTVLDSMKKYNIKYIIIDRTFFLDNAPNDILTIQRVPPEIYEASYPAWFFSLSKLISLFKYNYNILFKWNCTEHHCLNNYKTSVCGFFLERIFN